jgi:ribosomal protein S18 acetylase RimI-like enzyme
MMEKLVTLKDDTEVLFRPNKSQDFEMVWDMLSTLSEESLRFLPHPFIKEEIMRMIIEINHRELLPIVAVAEEPDSRRRIVAVATLGFQQGVARRHRAEFDIVVHDDYQGRGLGTMLTRHMIDIAREKGLRKVYLKTSTQNLRAIHLYKKMGFRIEGRLVMEHYHHRRQEYGDDFRMAILL